MFANIDSPTAGSESGIAGPARQGVAPHAARLESVTLEVTVLRCGSKPVNGLQLCVNVGLPRGARKCLTEWSMGGGTLKTEQGFIGLSRIAPNLAVCG